MNLKGIHVIFMFVGLIQVSTVQFRGGYISWKPDPDVTNQIIVTWRLSWKDTPYVFTSCDQAQFKYQGILIGGVQCSPDCDPSEVVGDVFCTAFSPSTSPDNDWYSIVNTATFQLNNPTALLYSGFNDADGGFGELIAHVDLKQRPDNNKINTSPTTVEPAIVYTQERCQITINVPVYDADGDVIRCRLVKGELRDLTRRSADVPTSHAYLDEQNCRLTFMVVTNNEEYTAFIALAVEDFLPPYTTSSQPLSTIPLQFLVKVTSPDDLVPCNQRPVFVSPTPADGAVITVAPGSTLSIELRARGSTTNLPVTTFITIHPRGLTRSDLKDGGNDETFITLQWTPMYEQWSDVELLCFSADDGVQVSEQRCVTVAVGLGCSVGGSLNETGRTYLVSIVVVMPYHLILCDGELTEWEYWAGNPGRFRAMIVRPIAEDPNIFNIVGINDITVTSAGADRKTTCIVPQNERFAVESGDMIAVGIFVDDNPYLQFDYAPEKIIQYVAIDPATLNSGGILTTYNTDEIEPSIAVNIRIEDNERPYINGIPPTQRLNTDTNLATATVSWTPPTADDNSGKAVILTSSHNTGDEFNIGFTTVIYIAVDLSGNTATASFDVVVADKEPPVIIGIPHTQQLHTDPNLATAIVFWTPPTTSDNSGEAVTLTSDYSPGDHFTIGNTRVTYSAEDVYGNTATYSFDIIVTDREPPVIVDMPPTQQWNTDHNLGTATVFWTSPTAIDNAGETVALTSDYHSKDEFTIGNTTVTYTAIDMYGNTATSAFDVAVTDNELPRITSGCPALIVVVTDQVSKPISWPTPNFTDNSGLLEWKSNFISPFIFKVGTHSVRYFVQDASGNGANCTIDINVTAVCYASSSTLVARNFSWPLSRAEGRQIESLEACGNQTKTSGRGQAVRVCKFDETYSGSRWLDAKYVGCGEEKDYKISLTELSKTAVIKQTVVSVAQAAVNVTKGLQNTTSHDIEEVAKTLSNIVKVGSDDPQVTVSVVSIVNNIITAVDTDSASGNKDNLNILEGDNSENLLDILTDFEKQIERATSSGQNIPPVVESNIIITITNVPPESNDDVTFTVTTSNSDEADKSGFDDVDVGLNKNATPSKNEIRTSVSLPSSIFQEANTSLGVSFVVHRSDILFQTNSTKEGRDVAGDILSVIVTGADDLTKLSDPVVLEFTAQGRGPSCVFWDFAIQDWSQEGCQLAKHLTSRVTCHCNHLTNFAVLIDANQVHGHIILDAISKVGCVVSMIALLVTIVIYVGFRRLRRGRGPKATARKILIQFSLALCLLYFFFLVGIDQTQNRGGCIFVAMLLQYLTLSSLMWMGIEAQNLYANIVRVFDPKSDHFLLRASIAAWGIPLLITVISVAADTFSYDHLNYCFVASYPLYFGVILPVAVILLHNLVIFGMVIRVLWRTKVGGSMTQAKSFSTSQRLKNAIAISTLMGLTWLFGFFAIEDAEFVVSLIFCLCNSFQGIVIFILFCARQDDVQTILRPYYNRICCTRVRNMRRLSETGSTGLPSGSDLVTRPSKSEDQFRQYTFEPVNSEVFPDVFESTSQQHVQSDTGTNSKNGNGTKGEIGFEVTVDDFNEKPHVGDNSDTDSSSELDEYAEQCTPIAYEPVNLADFESSELENEMSDRVKSGNCTNNEIHLEIPLKDLGNKSNTKDDSPNGRDSAGQCRLNAYKPEYLGDSESTDEQTMANDLKNENDTTKNIHHKVPSADKKEEKSPVGDISSKDASSETSGGNKKPCKYKRRIFSMYSVIVDSEGDHEENDLQQSASDNTADGEHENNWEDNDKDKMNLEDNDTDKMNADESEDEDMLVAPIEIENEVKDAHVEIDKD